MVEKKALAGLIIVVAAVAIIIPTIVFWPQEQENEDYNLWSSESKPAGGIIFTNGTRDENVSVASIVDNVRAGVFTPVSITQDIGGVKYNITGVTPTAIMNSLQMWDAYNIDFKNSSMTANINAKHLTMSTEFLGKAFSDQGTSYPSGYQYAIIIAIAVNNTYLAHSKYPNAAAYGNAWVYNPLLPASSQIINLARVEIKNGWTINITVHRGATVVTEFVIDRTNVSVDTITKAFWYRDFSQSDYYKQHYDVTYTGRTLYSIMKNTSVNPDTDIYNMTIIAIDGLKVGADFYSKYGGGGNKHPINQTDIKFGSSWVNDTVAVDPNNPGVKTPMNNMGLLPVLVYQEDDDTGAGAVPQTHQWSTGPIRLIYPGWAKSWYQRFIESIDIYVG